MSVVLFFSFSLSVVSLSLSSVEQEEEEDSIPAAACASKNMPYCILCERFVITKYSLLSLLFVLCFCVLCLPQQILSLLELQTLQALGLCEDNEE